MKHRTEAEQLIKMTTPGRLAAPESDVLVPVLQAFAIASELCDRLGDASTQPRFPSLDAATDGMSLGGWDCCVISVPHPT
jgi:hypothetical protein